MTGTGNRILRGFDNAAKLGFFRLLRNVIGLTTKGGLSNSMIVIGLTTGKGSMTGTGNRILRGFDNAAKLGFFRLLRNVIGLTTKGGSSNSMTVIGLTTEKGSMTGTGNCILRDFDNTARLGFFRLLRNVIGLITKEGLAGSRTGEGFDNTVILGFLRLLRNVIGLTIEEGSFCLLRNIVGQGGQGKHSSTVLDFDCTLRELFFFLLDTIRGPLTDIIFG
uniref:Uncharacterized protein n=1 Tax=Pithovirus LCPAC401 TaxID=2506595 RepID=A0A481Z9F0_9VIRU|nr:MAG: hypothetical protein LCPAC401_01520 [Pithovirus LCPAC401]